MEFIIKSALLLTLLYGCFALLLSRETFHRFNRIALLSTLIVSLVLPAVKLTIQKPAYINPIAPIEFVIKPKAATTVQDTGIQATIAQQPGTIMEAEAPTYGFIIMQVLWTLYLIGVVVSVGIFCIQLFRFLQDIKGGVRTKDEWGNTIVIHGGNYSPYSFFHYIIISVTDYEQLRDPILAHEQAHIRLGHSWDLMQLQLVTAIQWLNPFVYLLGRSLKAVHEYEADSAVLNFGIDAKQYQLLLVTKAVGNRLQTVGNCLNHHSLKKRIKMMYQKKSNRWMMLKALFIIPVACFALYTFATPKADSPVLQVKKTTSAPQKKVTTVRGRGIPSGEVKSDDKIYDIVEENAKFPGGEEACFKWIAENIQYPQEAKENKIQGRVTVSFVVEKDGTLTDVKVIGNPYKYISEEAVRVVKAMPKWNPAKIKGKIVRSRFRLPVNFRLN